MVGRHHRGDARRVEMRAPAAGHGVEAVGARRSRPQARHGEPGAFDPIAVAFGEQESPVVVVADEAHRRDRQVRDRAA